MHRVVSEWAHSEAARRLGEAASLAAMKRSDLNDTETELATNVLDLQHVQAQARLYSERAGDEKLVECPYKGLASFDVSDAQFFHGRERVVAELIARLAGSGLLAVAGASGSGKSSIVRAGLIPALHAGVLPGSERWTTCLMRPGAHPSRELDRVVFAAIDEDVRSRLPADGDALEGAVEVLPEGSRLVLVVDQFEETFTLCTDTAERDAFVASLVRAARHPRAAVVLAIRADFFGRCAEYPELAELAGPGNVLVGGMSADEYRRAIEEPAKRSGLRLEPALVEGLVAEVVGEPGGLPLLSTALVEQWQQRDGRVLRFETYQRTGGVHGAVARLAEASHAALTPQQQSVERAVLLRLAAGEGDSVVRRRIPVAELDASNNPDVAAVVDAFVRDRLLTVSEGTVEVAHEALLREWPRLRDWLEEDREGQRLRQHLIEQAREWDEMGRDTSELYRGARLSAALDWTTDHTLELNEREREFVNASRAENERELTRQRRQNRRLRFILAAVAVLLLLAVAAGAVALVARARSRHDATVALAGRLGAQAVSEPRIDRAVLLAREAVNLNRSSQTEGTLLATLLRSPAAVATFTTPITERPQGVAVSPDGKTLAVVMNEGMMRLYDSRTHRQRLAFPAANAPFAYLAGRHELLAGAPGTIPDYELLDDRTGRVVQKFELGKLWLNTLSVFNEPVLGTPDGRYVFLLWAAQKPDGSGGPAYIQRWTTTQGGKPLVVPMHLDGMIAATATRDGKLVVATDQAVSIWNATTLRRIRTIAVSGVGSAFGGAVSPDGRTVAYGFADGTVHFVDLSTGKQTAGAGAHAGHVQAVAFSPDSRVAVSSGDDGLVIVWDPATGQPIQRLTGHAGRVLGVGFSRDGKTLYTSSLDGAIFKWDLGTAHRFGLPFATTAAPETPQLGPDTPQTPPLAVSPDGARFAVRVGSSRVALYSTSTARRLATFSPGLGDVTGIAWSRSGEVGVSGPNGRVQLWNVAGAPRLVRKLTGLGSINKLPETVTAISFSADGTLVAAGDVNHTPGTANPLATVAVWEAATGKRLWTARTKRIGVAALPFAPGGATIAAAFEDGTVALLDARDGRVERTLRPEGAGPFTFQTDAYSHDGALLATGTLAGIAQLWSPNDGRQIGHPTLVAAAPVASLDFAPSDETFATAGGSDGLAKLWTTATQQQFGATFPGPPGNWGNAVHTPDGSKLIVVYQDGTGDIWPTAVQNWEDHACAVAGRNLTREEWARSVSGHAYTRTCPNLPSG